MEAMTEETGRVGLNYHDQDRHQSRENGHDQAMEMKEQQQVVGKINNNGRKNEKTMLRTPADIFEHPSFYSFILDMPGLDAQNIKVKVENGILHVTGKKTKQQMGATANEEDGGVVKVIRIERRRARYMRKFTLPLDATHDNVKATYKDGVLSITVSKNLSVEIGNSTANSFTSVSIS